MDLEAIVLGILATAVFLVPIFFIQRKQKGEANKAKKAFLAAASAQGLNIGQHDFWNERYGIGMDEAQGQIFYWHNEEADLQESIIDLSSVRKTSIDNMHRDVNGNRIIDMIVLRVALHGPKAPELYLPFYNREGSMMLSGELQLAEKWSNIIQQNMAKMQAVQV
ncbi:hypothetical protein [Pontibacter sp. BAB1700]|uniref:hypothetical protein n=1 Tax=Pontibacter sp. BAB1700 TaxID=1144253 RepID=UPI00031B9D6C|nr:hypothetical protein [Pontibacter sp. BAB1700]